MESFSGRRTIMDPSMIMASEYRQHRAPTIASRRMMTPRFDLSLSLLSNTAIGYSIPFQPMSFNYSSQHATSTAFDAYNNLPPPSTALPPSLTITQDMPYVREARNAISNCTDEPYVKLERKSPENGALIFRVPSSPSTDASETAHDANFGTDVDTLMRAIQTKTRVRPQQRQATLSSQRGSSIASENAVQDHQSEFDRNSSKSRKKYQCDVASCAKTFFQKTHLDIHMRAHTGYKPFVSPASYQEDSTANDNIRAAL